MSISPKPVPLPGSGEEEKERGAAPAAAASEKPAEKPEEKAAEAAPAKARAVKTVFEYRGAGKKVALAGSFSVWRELPMSRRDGAWRTEAYIFPGTYTYHFIVDGVKTADPGKPRARTGDSIVAVE